MNWLVLTRQEQAALLFLTGTLLMGCLVLVADAWRKEGLPDFQVIPGAVAHPGIEAQEQVGAADSSPTTAGVISSGRAPSVSAGPYSAAVTGAPPADAEEGIIAVNSADLAAWESLPGIGPHTAAAIVAYRQQHGRFHSIDELVQVRGIGERTLSRLRPRLRLD